MIEHAPDWDCWAHEPKVVLEGKREWVPASDDWNIYPNTNVFALRDLSAGTELTLGHFVPRDLQRLLTAMAQLPRTPNCKVLWIAGTLVQVLVTEHILSGEVLVCERGSSPLA